MGMPRIFSIEEANALVPELSRIVGQQMRQKAEIEERVEKLAELTGASPPELPPSDDDSAEVRGLKAELLERMAAYREGWRKVAELGAVVKDPRIGLVDFYGRLDGRAVWFCWRYGETQIDWYHEIDAGFSGRKRLDPSIRRSLLN